MSNWIDILMKEDVVQMCYSWKTEKANILDHKLNYKAKPGRWSNKS